VRWPARLPGLAGFWGEFPAILSAYSPVAGLKGRPSLHGHRRVGTVLAAATCCAVPAHVRRATAEFVHDSHIHTSRCLSGSLTPLLVAILVLGVYPNILAS
jgi:NADH-quinone oxidoreductase subunit M